MTVSDGGGVPPAISSSAEGETISFTYTERGSDMVGLTIKNALLNIVTLSLYRFWGKTEVRRRILAAVEINGEPMEYLGTGWELFRGFLIVVFGFFLPAIILIGVAQFFAPALMMFIPLMFYLALIYFANFAVYSARRYRFSRAAWRGVRFSMIGSANDYAWVSIGYGILTSFTLGWFTPAASMRLTRRMWEETSFGHRSFKIAIDENRLSAGLYGPFALFWVVSAALYVGLIAGLGFYSVNNPDMMVEPDFGVLAVYYGAIFLGVAVAALASLPYQAALMRRKAEMVGFGAARFSLDASSGSLLGLYFTNGLLLILTLGLAEPIATSRTFRYVFTRLTSKGTVDFEAIRQSQTRGPSSGEGLADAFDVGGF